MRISYLKFSLKRTKNRAHEYIKLSTCSAQCTYIDINSCVVDEVLLACYILIIYIRYILIIEPQHFKKYINRLTSKKWKVILEVHVNLQFYTWSEFGLRQKKYKLGPDYMSRAGLVCRDLDTSVKRNKNQLRDDMTAEPFLLSEIPVSRCWDPG